MSADVIQLETHSSDLRRQEHVGQFLRFSSIQSAIARERIQALEQLDAITLKLERLHGSRSLSSVDLDPYTRMLREHLRSARRRFGNPKNADTEECFLDAAFRFARRLHELSPEPVTVRTHPPSEDARTATG